MMGDFTSVYWIAGAIVVVLWVVQALLKSARPAIRGNIGEAVVSGRLGSLPNDVYKVINNVMLPTVDGATTQIDHVVVSRYGIFVVETKDYGGWIFGGENQRQWTQSFRTRWGADKYRFQNPIRQNWRHIYTMSDLLKMPRRYFFNVVAFCGDGEFMTEMPENVMYSADLARYIRSFDRPLLSEAMVEKVCLAIGAWICRWAMSVRRHMWLIFGRAMMLCSCRSHANGGNSSVLSAEPRWFCVTGSQTVRRFMVARSIRSARG